MEDHLHNLTSLYPPVSLADFVKEVKTGSALWIKGNGVFKSFSYWQEGYAAFTSSRRAIDDLIGYIKRQQKRHRKVTFGKEYGKLLRVWLLFDDAPSASRMESFLLSLNVERPVWVEISTQVNRSELHDSLRHSFSPAHA